MEAPTVLREARRRAGLTIRQVASRAHTSHSAVAAYEAGTKSPNSATLERLVRACGFELEAHLRPTGPFEDHRERGHELLEVLDLADQFPSRRRSRIAGRFPSP